MNSDSCPTCDNPTSPFGGLCPRCLLGLGVAEATTSAGPADYEPGDVIGSYRLERLLGKGGMGVVFLAEQRVPIRRQVALKLIKLGMDTREVIARFETERQALAMMSHPNVAQVYDASATPEGRPYFVMEYVAGESITDYYKRHQLEVEERLELFVEACEGIQHAHLKGVIHRDVKPSNLIVAAEHGRPQLKVIDFGVAKATEQGAERHAQSTRRELVLGTPQYMSPEQARPQGGDVDSRTDVYSLGVVLYELLTDLHPLGDLDSAARAPFELLRRVCEEDPPAPSRRLSRSGVAPDHAALGVHKARARRLRGDLDWIVMRAMAKDRKRRFPTPSALAEDIRRHLKGLPVEAGPPGSAYRVRKFVTRHRGPVVAGTLTLLALLVGAVTSATFAVREARQRRAAEAARQEAADRALALEQASNRLQSIMDFQGSMLERMDPRLLGVGVLEEIRAQLREPASPALGGVLADTGQYEKALPVIRRAVESYRSSVAGNDRRLLFAMRNLGLVLSHLDRCEEALPLLDETFRALEGATPMADLEVGLETDRGRCLTSLGRYPEAERSLLAARAITAEQYPRNLSLIDTTLERLYRAWQQIDPAGQHDRKLAKLRASAATGTRATAD